MEKMTVAERLLAMLTTPERANEVMGDLEEQKFTRGQIWTTVGRIAARSLFGSAIAFLYALTACGSFAVAYCLLVVPRWKLPHHESWAVISVALAAAALCLGTVAAWTLRQYGLHDRVARMSCLVWATVAVCAWAVSLPHALGPVVVTLLGAAGALLWWSKTRAALLCVLAPTAAYAFCLGLFYLFTRVTLLPHTARMSVADLLFAGLAFATSLAVEQVTLRRVRPKLAI